MKNTLGLFLGASDRRRYAGTAAVEDLALGASTPSAIPARRDWRKTKNARGAPTASPVLPAADSKSIRKPDEPYFAEVQLESELLQNGD